MACTSSGGTSSSTSSCTCRISRLAGRLGGQALVEPDQRHLEDVGGQALDAGVHGLALAGLADAEVRRRQLGDLAAPPEQRLGVAALARLGDRALHVGLHGRERHEVGVEDLGRLLGGDVEALAEPVGLHAVGEAVGDHLRLRPHLDRDVGGLDAEDRATPSRCGCRGRDSKLSIRPGSSARWAMQRSSIWL